MVGVMRGRPNGIRRWLRRKAEVVAVCCLTAAVVLAPVTAGVGLAAVQHAVDKNWRGSYDILALANDDSLISTSAAETLVDPNFANTSAVSIPNKLVKDVTTLQGVSLAAPIGFLGRLGDVRDYPIIQIPAQLFRDDPIRTIRLNWTAKTDDGLGPRIADHQVFTLHFDARAWDGSSDIGPGDKVISVTGPVPAQVTLSDNIVRVGLWPLPSVASTIFAVDPTAEQELLGNRAPPALAALATADQALKSMKAEVGRWPTTKDVASLSPDRPELRLLSQVVPHLSSTPALQGQYGKDASVAPFIAARDALPKLSLTVGFKISPVGMDRPISDLVSVGTVNVNATAVVTPFASTGVIVPWPGTPPAAPTTYVQPSVVTGVGASKLVKRPSGSAPDPSRRAFTLNPQGFLRAIPLDTRVKDDGLAPGQTQTYRAAPPNGSLQIGSASATGQGAPLLVGNYDNSALTAKPTDNAPLGAYDPGAATRITDGTGKPVTPTKLLPALSGLGIVAQPATAITSLAGARAMGVNSPVTAIRVRVAGVKTYSTSSITRISAVASQIQKLGLRAFIVAGSSRQTLQTWIPDYAFGVENPTLTQKVSDLGWVQLEAVSLNVAQSTVESLTTLAHTISLGSILLTFATLPLLGMSQLRVNHRTNAVLQKSGLAKSERFRWFLAEGLPGVIIVALGGVLGAATLTGELLQGLILSGAAALSVMILVLGVAIASVRVRPKTRPLRAWAAVVGNTIVSPVVKLSLRKVPTMLVTGILLAFVAVCSSIGAALVSAGLREVSRTPLGGLIGGAQVPYLVASLATGITAAVVLTSTVVARHTSISATQATTLSRVGAWSRQRLRLLSIVEVAGIAVVAMLVAAILILLTPTDISPLAEFGTLPAVGVLLCAVAVPIGAIAVARARGIAAAQAR